MAVVAALVMVAGIVGPHLWVRASSRGHVYAAAQVADVPPAPVALVLGAGLTPAQEPTPFLADRLNLAKALLDAGRVKIILVSGDNRTVNYDEPTAMRDYLVAKGVSADLIVSDFAGRDTYDSCARAKRIFGVTRLIVVSQSFHIPRAVATCRSVGVDTDGIGDDASRRFSSAWSTGAQREWFASIKTVIDVTTGRDPVLGDPESGVRDALTVAGQQPTR